MNVTVRAAGWSVASSGVAATTGFVAGALTARLQGTLPQDWNTVADSGAVWTVIAFAIAAALSRRRESAACIGGLVLVGEVVGYYGYVSSIRQLPVLHAEVLLWTMAALWIGPLVGLAAFFARWGTRDQRVLALIGMCGVVVGEGSYLVRSGGAPVSGWVEVAIGTAAAAGLLAFAPASFRSRVAALGVGAVVMAAVYLVYGQPSFA